MDGREVSLAHESVFLILNKPAGYVTTMDDPQGRPCVASLVPTDAYPGLFPVGRLDMDTTGILLFTTNGECAQGLLHPSRHVDKHYVALVEGVPTAHQLDRLRSGITLDDGYCQPARVEMVEPGSRLAAAVAPNGPGKGRSIVGMTIHEGRKHQVKRMLMYVNHPVISLHRDTFGPLELGDLKPGVWRHLTKDERSELESIAAKESARQ